MTTPKKGWIGFDFDGTLAQYGGWNGDGKPGAPIEKMVRRAKAVLAAGTEIRIFTARVSGRDEAEVAFERERLEAWSVEHLGQKVPITCQKDYQMVGLYDDRAFGVEQNLGELSTDILQSHLDEAFAREQGARERLRVAEENLETAKLVIEALKAELGRGEGEPLPPTKES